MCQIALIRICLYANTGNKYLSVTIIKVDNMILKEDVKLFGSRFTESC